MHALLSRTIALTGGLAVALLAGEVVIRVAGAAPEVAWIARDQFQLSPNTLIGWEPIPDPEAAGAPPGAWLPSERNALGFRDATHDRESRAGTYRILVLGDSITKGLGVSDHDAIFTSVMAERLAAAGLQAEVINFGVEGYNTQQEVETLRDKGLAYHPALVVLAYCLNDRDWPAHHLYRELLEAEARGTAVASVRLPLWIGHSALYRFLRFRVLGGAAQGPADDRIQTLIDAVQKDTVDEYFGVLETLSRENGFEVLVVVFPWMDDPSHDRRLEEHRRMAALALRHGFHHLDLLPMFLECERHYGHSVAADEVHPNALGHRCAGLAIADQITRRIAAPRGGS